MNPKGTPAASMRRKYRAGRVPINKDESAYARTRNKAPQPVYYNDVPTGALVALFVVTATLAVTYNRLYGEDAPENSHNMAALVNPVPYEQSIEHMAFVRCPLTEASVVIDWVKTINNLEQSELDALKPGHELIFPDCPQPTDSTLPD